MVDSAKLCPVHHGGVAAYYSPKDDVIRMPAPSIFTAKASREKCSSRWRWLSYTIRLGNLDSRRWILENNSPIQNLIKFLGARFTRLTVFYLLCNSSMVTMNRHLEAFRDIKALNALQRGSRASACRCFELKGGM